MNSPFAPNHHHPANNSNNNNHYKFPPNHDGGVGMMGPIPQMDPHMNHHPMAAGPPVGPVYPRGGPGSVGPVQKLNVRCRFYSKTSNKCTWGDQCRFEHRDDSPGPGEVFDPRIPPGPHPAMLVRGQAGPPPPPMGPAERPYPPYTNRNQPYPMPPHGYGPYDPYGQPQPSHHQSPPLPPHPMQSHHWRQQQQSPVYHTSPSGSAHPRPESLSPSHPSNAVVGPIAGGSPGGSTQPTGGTPGPAPCGEPPAGYPPSSSASSAVYERKHRLAYELAPWNDRGSVYPPNKYERGDPAVAGGYPPPPSSRFYRSQYNKDPYGRDHQGPSPYYMGGPPHPSYPPGYPPNYPSSYYGRGGPMGPHASHYRYMSSSQRNVPPDSRRSRSNKRGHDEDESSWSDSGSEDSILGQASYSNKSHTNKSSKRLHHQNMPPQHQLHHHPSQRNQETPTPAMLDDTNSNDNPLDQGSGTPPGEPLPEDKERQEMLLNKLKEIEDLMAKKKGEQEQEDPV